MHTFNPKKSGLIAKILTFHVDRKRDDFEKKVSTLLERQKGACGLFWSVAWRLVPFILYRTYKFIVDTILSVLALLVKLIFAVFAIYWAGYKPDFSWWHVDVNNNEKPLFIVMDSKVDKEGFAEFGPMMLPTLIALGLAVLCFFGQFTFWVHEMTPLMPESVSEFANANLVTYWLISGVHLAMLLTLMVLIILTVPFFERTSQNEFAQLILTKIRSKKDKICPRVEFV